ncbi:multiple sugar transport system permease protein [Thermosporothrix hazakensis]|jgi:multiple sugar transport system permease protein|uniref:Multiple sugar transport system permease protein n=1 Tax=Thermosporothrix hazakensis TaxID=644383 RepID=A0A326UAK1_THEHA|nr:carbohydrate ABC transporter permease [Thermosporothrix hazakensis]PZW34286.1 multiple sugar transport system permease protein [Thermosporothrix hazakensis]GCE46161.1 sugar ABC transporter permease [Thermosporothrix hazakensis]
MSSVVVNAPERRFRRPHISQVVAFLLLLFLMVLWAIPLLWAVDTSFKPEGETTVIPVSWIPTHFTGAAYENVLNAGNLLRWYFNSFLTSILITMLAVFFASLAAYALSRIPFRGSKFVFWVILAGLMVPGQILIVPLFSLMQLFGLVNTYAGVIVVQIASPIAVFIFKQFFDSLPHELEEAAVIDGAGRWRLYWQVWLPLSRSAVAAVAIFTFVSAWNNFLWPYIVVTGVDMMTVPVGLATVQTAYGIHYAQVMASAVLGALPALIVFLFFQRQIVQGIAGTGIKG